MVNAKRTIIVSLSVISLLVLVLTADKMTLSVQESVRLCLYTVIPSLFPFMIITGIITSNLTGTQIHLLRPIGRICKIPEGLESLIPISFFGGYPVGAKNVYDVYRSGILSRENAARMIAFCNNAGPSFIFGILGGLFAQPSTLFILWLVPVVSAILVGISLPGSVEKAIPPPNFHKVSISSIIISSVKNTAIICGWIIIFRIPMDMLQQHMIHMPRHLLILLNGMLELTNGCMLLTSIQSEGARFILASFLLSFGGLCVIMQTAAVTDGLGLKKYISGKLLQGNYSILLACILQHLLFDNTQQYSVPPTIYLLLLFICFASVFYMNKKKTVAFFRKILYNTSKQTQEVSLCCSEKRSPVPVAIAHTEPN